MAVEQFIEAEGLEKRYTSGTGEVAVIRDLDLGVAPGEVVAILGISGTGKSTLLNLLGGIDRPDRGRLRVNGYDLPRLSDRGLTRYRGHTVGFIFQFYNLLPSLTAFENVLTALEAVGPVGAEHRARISELFAAVGLTGQQDKFPEQLSGGEQQRVAIARALAKHPPLILADEPTGNLDPDTGDSILKLLVRQARATAATLLLVTHNPAVAGLTDRALAMREGRLVPV